MAGRLVDFCAGRFRQLVSWVDVVPGNGVFSEFAPFRFLFLDQPGANKLNGYQGRFRNTA